MNDRFITTPDGFDYDTDLVGIGATYLRQTLAGRRDWQLHRAVRRRAAGVHAQGPRTPDGRFTCCCGLVLPIGVGPLDHPGHLDLNHFILADVVVVEAGPPLWAYCQECGWSLEQVYGVDARTEADVHRDACPDHPSIQPRPAAAGFDPDNLLDPRHPHWEGNFG